MHHVCHAVDRMGDTRVRFKCAKAVRLCAARGLHVGYETHSQSAGTCVVGWEKTPSFSFCQVDMYDIPTDHLLKIECRVVRECCCMFVSYSDCTLVNDTTMPFDTRVSSVLCKRMTRFAGHV